MMDGMNGMMGGMDGMGGIPARRRIQFMTWREGGREGGMKGVRCSVDSLVVYSILVKSGYLGGQNSLCLQCPQCFGVFILT